MFLALVVFNNKQWLNASPLALAFFSSLADEHKYLTLEYKRTKEKAQEASDQFKVATGICSTIGTNNKNKTKYMFI